MKKSLVITTIATVLVIVVALTTATFAWFSAGTTSAVTSSFSAQADNAAFSFRRWIGNDAYDVNSTTKIDFTDVSYGNGTNNTNYAIWSSTGMVAVAPITEIATGTPVIMEDANDDMKVLGLPGANFYSAQSNGSNANVSAITYLDPTALTVPASTDIALAYPNVARFMLVNGKNYAQAVQVTVTVTPGSNQNNADVYATQGLRFLMIAKPTATGSDGAIGFVLGTQYSYGMKKGGTNVFSGTVPSDTSQSGVTYDTVSASSEDGTNMILAPETLDGGSSISYKLLATDPVTTTKDGYAKAMLPARASYEVYLYVWLDGTTVGASASNGQFSFNISFTGAELTETVQGD